MWFAIIEVTTAGAARAGVQLDANEARRWHRGGRASVAKSAEEDHEVFESHFARRVRQSFAGGESSRRRRRTLIGGSPTASKEVDAAQVEEVLAQGAEVGTLGHGESVRRMKRIE